MKWFLQPLTLWFLLCASRVRGLASVFNVDIREPILRQSPTVLSGENVEDYFGFAVVLHQVEEVQPGEDMMTVAGKTRIIVGAPRGTFPGGLNLPDPGEPAINRTGLIYSCTILPGTQCDAVRGDEDMFQDGDEIDNDGLHGAGRLFDHRPDAIVDTPVTRVVAESKENQLLGATLYSNGDTFVVCAPSWSATGVYDSTLQSPNNMLNSANRLPRGRCYWTVRNLTRVTFLDPCNSNTDGNDPRIDGGQPYCTAGTGITVLSTPAESQEFVIGAPGYDRGKGALFWGENQQQMEDRGERNDYGRGNVEHSRFSMSGLFEIIEVSQGFQVVSGYITQGRDETSNPPNVLASVPRHDSSDYRGRIDVYDVGSIQTLLNITAEGTQLGEFFGYALDTADLNNDGYDEIIVGAPMYTDFDNLNVEKGRVYIFMNIGATVSSEPLILEGRAAGGRFGMSIINLGDIDQDGYEDIAVSAPYEASGDGSGAVYIYYGQSNWTAFEEQTPSKISAQDMADQLIGVTSVSTFGFSLAGQVDVDANEYNDLVIGAFESRQIFVLRSLPVANVDVQLVPLEAEVKRTERNCDVEGTMYACFDIRLQVTYTGVGLSGAYDVTVVLSERRSNNERRVFFNGDTSSGQLSVTLQLNPSASRTERIYILNNIVDSVSPLELMATVEQNDLPISGPSDGNPEITDLDSDFRIRLPDPALAQVELLNNCGDNDICETDSSLIVDDISYLPAGRGYTSIEVGGVERVTFHLILTNNGDEEDAIRLSLAVNHSRSGVFLDQFTITFSDGDSDTCSPCNVRELRPTEQMNLLVTLSVRTGLVVGGVETTFRLTSEQTRDDNLNNNMQTVSLIVERRADLTVSVSFLQEEVVYSSVVPTNVQERSDVGIRIPLEVVVENVGSTDIDNARLEIYYPARSPATGQFFFLLPDCSVDLGDTGTINCNSSALESASPLPCNGGNRKRRHTISPVVKQRRREAKAATSIMDRAVRRMARQETSAQTAATSLNCRATPQNCLLVTCDISGLQGQGANRAKVTLPGYVDDRFFADASADYQLTALANVFFNETAEETMDSMQEPDQDTALLRLREEVEAEDEESPVILIVVIVVIILVSVILIIVLAVILYCCGFFRRKKKPLLEEEEDTGVTVTETTEQAAAQPAEATTL